MVFSRNIESDFIGYFWRSVRRTNEYRFSQGRQIEDNIPFVTKFVKKSVFHFAGLWNVVDKTDALCDTILRNNCFGLLP